MNVSEEFKVGGLNVEIKPGQNLNKITEKPCDTFYRKKVAHSLYYNSLLKLNKDKSFIQLLRDYCIYNKLQILF